MRTQSTSSSGSAAKSTVQANKIENNTTITELKINNVSETDELQKIIIMTESTDIQKSGQKSMDMIWFCTYASTSSKRKASPKEYEDLRKSFWN